MLRPKRSQTGKSQYIFIGLLSPTDNLITSKNVPLDPKSRKVKDVLCMLLDGEFLVMLPYTQVTVSERQGTSSEARILFLKFILPGNGFK